MVTICHIFLYQCMRSVFSDSRFTFAFEIWYFMRIQHNLTGFNLALLLLSKKIKTLSQLCFIQSRIFAFFGQEFLMCSLFNNLTVI